MPNVFDSDENLIGSIEHEDGRIIAYDIEGRKLGTYSTSFEAVSALHRAWREPEVTEHDEQMLFERIAAKLRAGTND